jgi:putative transposase
MKGSQNREKARRQVAKIHEQIKNARSDYLHKLTTRFKVKSEQ